MWNVTIRDKGVKDEAITIQVEFSKGEESIVRNFAGNTKDELDRRIKQQLDALTKRDENIELVATGEWTAPVEEAPEPTAEEQAEAEWIDAHNRLKKAQELADMAVKAGQEVTPERQQLIDDLAVYVNTNFKPEYVTKI